VGIETVERLRIYNIDKAFMAATGLSLDRGLTNASVYEYNIKKEVISRSRKRFLMADHSKFGKTALYTFCDFENLDAVITDMPPEAEYRDYFRSQNIELLS
ncbi:MAG: DeoR/GlpR transcriptional regulator, partial [Oribacterium sp.]